MRPCCVTGACTYTHVHNNCTHIGICRAGEATTPGELCIYFYVRSTEDNPSRLALAFANQPTHTPSRDLQHRSDRGIDTYRQTGAPAFVPGLPHSSPSGLPVQHVPATCIYILTYRVPNQLRLIHPGNLILRGNNIPDLDPKRTQFKGPSLYPTPPPPYIVCRTPGHRPTGCRPGAVRRPTKAAPTQKQSQGWWLFLFCLLDFP